MQIKVSVKQLGKKRPVINQKLLEIDNLKNPVLLSDFINKVVKQQVESYNAKTAEENLMNFLTPPQVEEKTSTGKVGFGSIYNENKANIEKAQATALQAFEDGMFCVFYNDEQIEKLIDKFDITEESTFTFVRLTFLVGSFW